MKRLALQTLTWAIWRIACTAGRVVDKRCEALGDCGDRE